jgi:hypothetical protein
MNRLLPAALLGIALVAGACSGGPVALQGACTNVVQVGGTLYARSGPPPENAIVGPEHARTLRQRTCDDVIRYEDGQPVPTPEAWQDGDALALPVGTPLYELEGSSPAEVLLVRHPGGEWMEMRRLPFE